MGNFVNLITQIIAGAFTGYITNTYAINMLFKEYKIFNSIKIGGVIINTKDDFIDRISKLVEKDIINYKTLDRELHKPEFEKTIENFVKDFFKDALAQRLCDLKIKDLKGSAESIQEMEKFINKIIESNIDEAKDVAFKNLTVNDFASPDQLNFIIRNLVEKSLERINANDSLTIFTRTFVKEKGHLTLSELFQPSQDILKTELIKIQQEIPEVINEIFTSIDDETLFRTIQYQLNKKKIGDIVLPNARENTLEKLKENFQSFLSSEEGIILVSNLSVEIIKILKKTDKPLIQLLTPDFQKETENYLEKILPHFSAKIALWLRENSFVIEGLIQEGIEDIIENVQGMRGMVLSMIKDTILSNLASKNNVAEMIVDFIENKISLKEISEGITREIIKFLNKKSIKDIIISLENNDLLSPKIISAQLHKGINLLINSIDQEALDNSLNKTVGEVYTFDVKKDFIIKGISQSVSNKVESLLKVPIQKLIREEDISIKLKPSFDFQLSNAVYETDLVLNNINFKDIKFKLKDIKLDNFGEKDFLPILEKFNEIPDIHYKISQGILRQLHENLPHALNGKIENLVSENLNKLTPEEVNTVVHDFMGRELGPITKFGAFLGGIAGLFLALFVPAAGITSLSINPLSLLVYGGVGVLTNVIALEMIFRPYKEKNFLNKIGLSKFSQGYIMKNKKAFGKNMGKFVEESLLERRMISSRFGNLKSELANNIVKKISADDFAIMEKLISENEQKIISQVTKIILKSISDNKEKFSSIIAEKIATAKVGNLTGNKHEFFTEYFQEFLAMKYKELLFSKKPISELFPNQTKNNLELFLAKKGENFIENIDFEYFEEILLAKESQEIFQDTIKKPLSAWLDSKKIRENIFSQERIREVSEFIKTKLESPLESSQNIGNSFQGALVTYIEKNLPAILDKIELFIFEILNKNTSAIISKIQEDIYESLGLMQKGGYSLIGGDQLIEEVVQHIISSKIPPYLKESKEEIEKILINTLEENVYTIKLKDIQKNLRDREISCFVEEIFSSEETINNLMEIFENMAKVPVENYLKVAELDSLAKIYNIFQDEIKIVLEDFLKEVSLWKKDVSAKASWQIVNTVYNSLDELSPESIFSKNPHFYNLLEKGTQTRAELDNLLINIWEKDLCNETSGNILSQGILTRDLSEILEKISKNKEIEDYLFKINGKVITELKENRINFLCFETKKDITEQTTFAALDSLEKNLPEILSSLDFKTITEDEINKMEGREIHNLFKSFAGKYFNKLKLWGVIGALFGIHGGVSVLATLGYLIKRGEGNG